MEKFELEKRYEDDDEIDLVDLIKTIIKEKNTVIFITIFSIILAFGFIFYKNNKAYNYGMDISISKETRDNLNSYGLNNDLNKILEKSFVSLLENSESKVIILDSDNTQDIKDILEKDYDYIKILNIKEQKYKLFTKVKTQDLENITPELKQLILDDQKFLNKEFNKNLLELINSYNSDLNKLLDEIKVSNKKITDIIQVNFKDLSDENLNSNLAIIDPILYTQYQQEINSLKNLYSILNKLDTIKTKSEELLSFDGDTQINKTTLDNLESNKGISSKLILLIGAVLGIFAGIFIAVVKRPFFEILKEVKEEKN